MFKATTLADIPDTTLPCSLTIGCFDGVHLGHRALLHRARTLAGPQGSTALLTFSNHPAEVFSADLSIPKLCTSAQKLLLLKKAGIDLVINLEFTQALSSHSTEQFLSQLKEKLPFSHLILGRGARLGQNQEGDEKKVKHLQKRLNFSVEYLTKTTFGNLTISSGLIRKKIQENELAAAADLLGRPYSIYVDVDDKAEASTEGLCLPPKGSYKVAIHSDNGSHQETIQIAPTLTLPNTAPGLAEIVF